MMPFGLTCASSRVQQNGYYVSLGTSSRGCWKTVYSYFRKSFRYPNIVFVCIIRLTCPCEGTIAKCDFGIGPKSAELVPPPNNLYVFANSILSRPSLSPDMMSTGAEIFEIL